MAIRPITRSPILLLTISICLALPLLAISSHVLSSYRVEHASNPWWLPIWHEHFDNRGIVAVIVTSSIVFALDIVSIGLVVAGNKTGDKSKISKWTIVAVMLVATVASLVAMIMPAVTNAAVPSKSDTIQTWTCHWKDVDGAPDNFESLCHESKFTSYTPVPLFVIHLLLLVQSMQAAVAVPQPKPTFDEELVIITKSVDVASTGLHDSPRVDDSTMVAGKEYRV
ncbi:hypothetical protein E4T42_03450 [Aureobasidium subglaciale]|nr:hypothetical protein E4T42_03450 [Aureobasidium subglaciale]